METDRFSFMVDGILAGHVSKDSYGHFYGDLEYKHGDCVYLCQIDGASTLTEAMIQFKDFISSDFDDL